MRILTFTAPRLLALVAMTAVACGAQAAAAHSLDFDRIARDDTAGVRVGWQTRTWSGSADLTERFELPGSAVADALLDHGLHALVSARLGSNLKVRYVFAVHGGAVAVPPPAVPEPAGVWPALSWLARLRRVRRAAGSRT